MARVRLDGRAASSIAPPCCTLPSDGGARRGIAGAAAPSQVLAGGKAGSAYSATRRASPKVALSPCRCSPNVRSRKCTWPNDSDVPCRAERSASTSRAISSGAQGSLREPTRIVNSPGHTCRANTFSLRHHASSRVNRCS